MSNPKEPPRRILTSFQSTGRIGRSTLKQGLISWFGYTAIDFSAVDADPEHRTLSSWYPDYTTQIPYRNEDDLLAILNAPIQKPVHLIDFPSQATQSILKAFDHFGAFKLFHEQNSRLTIFIFASDERASMNSAHQIVTAFDSNADYVIVKNSARFTSRIFDDSKLPGILKKLNAQTIEMPRITGVTMETLDAASRRAKKSLTFREAEPVLEIGSKFELENWRNRLFAQFEDIAALLLPSPDLIQQKVERPKQKKLAVLDPYDI
jgi:hypothetical protein